MSNNAGDKTGIKSLHPEYEDSEYEWRQMRDTVGGSTPIKRSGDLYLPIPTAMLNAWAAKRASSTDNTGSTNLDKASKELKANAPWKHPNPFYSDYIHRARFPDLTSITHRALSGIAVKKAPVVELPKSINYLVDSCTPEGWTLVELFSYVISELLYVGRIELLVDITSENKAVIIPYVAESYKNWKEKIEDSEQIQNLAVLTELSSSEDEFEHNVEKEDYLVLRLEADEKTGKIVYTASRHQNGDEVSEKKTPSHMGRELDKIPLVVANAMHIGNEVGVSPLIGVSDVAISIYQKDADMSQSEYMSCNPFLVLTGVDLQSAPAAVGSSLALVLEDKDADAKYVEPSASSLDHMQTRIDSLFEEGIKYGVSLLGGKGNSAEATETLKMRQESQGATLKSIVRNAQNSIREVLEIISEWTSSKGEVQFDANFEFSESKISSEEQKALLMQLVEGSISYDTYFENLQKGGVFSEDLTAQEEYERIISKPNPVNDVDSDDGDGDSDNLDNKDES